MVNIDPTLMIGIPLFMGFLIPSVAIVWKNSPRYLAGFTILFNLIASTLLLIRSLNAPVISVLGGWQPPYGIVFVAGPLGSMLALLISSMTMLTWFYLPPHIKEGNETKFYMLFILLMAGATGMVLTGDLFNLFVFTEITSIASFSLLAYSRGKDEKEAVEATIKYMIIGSLSSAFFLIGIALLYGATGTLNMADLASKIPSANHNLVMMALAMIITGLGIEAEMFPLNGWTPDAYTGATHPVSVMFASVVVKAGFFALIRVVFLIFGAATEALQILMIFGLLTLFVGESSALRQTDLKRMLAYSSIGQMGLLLVAFSLNNQTALVGGLYAMLNHAIAKGLLFMAAGSFIFALGTRDISALNGMGKRMPVTSALFTIGAFSIMGLPFFGGFISKIVIIAGSMQAGTEGMLVAILILSASLIELVYFLRVVHRIWMREPEDDSRLKEAPFTQMFPMIVLAAFVFLMGIYPQAFFKVLIPAAQELLRGLGTMIGGA